MEITTAAPQPTQIQVPKFEPSKVPPTAAAPAPEPKVEPAKDSLTPRFAELTKREKANLAKEKQLKELETKYGNIDLTKPKAFLEKTGITLEKFIEGYLSESDTKPLETPTGIVKEMQDKLTKLEQEREQEKQLSLQTQQQENIRKFKENLVTQVKDKPEFKLVSTFSNPEFKHLSSPDLVISVMEEYYNKSEKETGEGQLLDWKVAAGEVEKFYKLIQETFTKVDAKPAPKEVKFTPTLTNHMSPSGAQQEDKMLSNEDSIKALAQKMKQMRQS